MPNRNFMSHSLAIAVVSVLAAVSALAQDDEKKFNQTQSERLSKFARKAQKEGFPRQARMIWLQAIKLYNPDDPEARKGLGHVKAGAVWVPDGKPEAPLDDTGTGADGIALGRAHE